MAAARSSRSVPLPLLDDSEVKRQMASYHYDCSEVELLALFVATRRLKDHVCVVFFLEMDEEWARSLLKHSGAVVAAVKLVLTREPRMEDSMLDILRKLLNQLEQVCRLRLGSTSTATFLAAFTPLALLQSRTMLVELYVRLAQYKGNVRKRIEWLRAAAAAKNAASHPSPAATAPVLAAPLTGPQSKKGEKRARQRARKAGKQEGPVIVEEAPAPSFSEIMHEGVEPSLDDDLPPLLSVNDNEKEPSQQTQQSRPKTSTRKKAPAQEKEPEKVFSVDGDSAGIGCLPDFPGFDIKEHAFSSIDYKKKAFHKAGALLMQASMQFDLEEFEKCQWTATRSTDLSVKLSTRDAGESKTIAFLLVVSLELLAKALLALCKYSRSSTTGERLILACRDFLVMRPTSTHIRLKLGKALGGIYQPDQPVVAANRSEGLARLKEAFDILSAYSYERTADPDSLAAACNSLANNLIIFRASEAGAAVDLFVAIGRSLIAAAPMRSPHKRVSDIEILANGASAKVHLRDMAGARALAKEYEAACKTAGVPYRPPR